MSDDSDDAWFEALRGHPRRGTDPVVLEHASGVRKVLLERRSEPDARADAEALERLLFRLKKENLLPGPTAGPARLWPAVVAASLAACAAALYVGINTRHALPGAPQDFPVVHKVRDPQYLAHEIREQLQMLNAAVTVTSSTDGSQSISARVPLSQTASARLMLASFGIESLTASGDLKVKLSVGETAAILRAQDPGRAATQLRAALLQAGSHVEYSDLGGGQLALRLTSTPEQHVAVASALQAFGLRPPGADGELRIDVRRVPQGAVWTAHRLLPPL